MTPWVQPSPETRLEKFAALMARIVPDAITTAVFLTVVVAVVAVSFANPFPNVMDAYYRGLWMLLPFTMQMTLIIVLSIALASTPLLRRGVAGLARIPKTRNQIIVLAFLANGVGSY